jgi:peptidyl-prolyl cis-trans isomerase C
VKTRRSLIVAAVVVATLVACRKAPAEQTGAPATPAATPPAAAAPAPPKPMPSDLPDVLATVNGKPVTRTDFERLIKNVEMSRGPIPAERRDEVYRTALDQLITYTVMKQEAEARNVAVPDAELDGRVKEMQGQMTADQFAKALSDRNTSAEQLKTDTRIDMMIDKMFQGEVSTIAAATDAEAKEFYEKNPDKFKQGESVRASHILVMAGENADEATKKAARTKIEGLLKRVRAGEDFAKLAAEYSDDGSKAQGGDLGFFQKGQMVPAFDQVAFSLAPGEVSDVVTTQFGYHIIKLAERRDPTTVPYEQVKPQIVEFLSSEKKRERVDAFIQEAKKRAKIEVLV